ncbi:unnamed protein product [Ectocarpus fasciculatus]
MLFSMRRPPTFMVFLFHFKGKRCPSCTWSREEYYTAPRMKQQKETRRAKNVTKIT